MSVLGIASGGIDRRQRFLVLAICCASMVVVVMDISIVSVALPTIRRDLHASVSGLQWTIDAYTLVLASFLMLAGSTADRVGRRRIFQVGLAAFGLGSLLCSLAPSIGWLIAARALQALGGTMLNPVSMAIIANTFTDPAERARAIGVFGSMSGLALALGPILGGALVDGLGWHSIFWINVPIVAAAIVCTALFVPESRPGAPIRPGGPDPGDPGAEHRRLRDHRVRAVGLDLADHPRRTRRRCTRRAGHPRLRTAPCRPTAGTAPVSQRAVQRGDLDGAVRLVRVRRVPVRDHRVPAGRAGHVGADGGAVPA